MIIDKDIQILPIFPEAILYLNILNVDNKKVLEYIKNINFEITNPSKINESNCYVSKNLNVLNDLKFLKNEINKNVDNYLHNLLKYKMDFKFLNSWFTKTTPKGYSQKHIHRNSFLSGVYYPFGNKDFKVNFYKEKENHWDIENREYNEFTSKKTTVTINKDNILVLFPSDLLHDIDINNSNLDRYSLAFTVNPKGYIGIKDSRICL